MAELVKIEYFRVPPCWLFIRLETSDATVGWGEATLECHPDAIEGALEHLPVVSLAVIPVQSRISDKHVIVGDFTEQVQCR